MKFPGLNDGQSSQVHLGIAVITHEKTTSYLNNIILSYSELAMLYTIDQRRIRASTYRFNNWNKMITQTLHSVLENEIFACFKTLNKASIAFVRSEFNAGDNNCCYKSLVNMCCICIKTFTKDILQNCVSSILRCFYLLGNFQIWMLNTLAKVYRKSVPLSQECVVYHDWQGQLNPIYWYPLLSNLCFHSQPITGRFFQLTPLIVMY